MCKKSFLIVLLALLATFVVFAQEDWDDDDWGDETTTSTNGESFGGFWNRFSISGDAELGGRIYFGSNDAEKTTVNAIPELELGLNYEGESTNFNAQINLSERTVLHNKMDILDEFHADLFLGDFVLSAGKMKVVWGKGDKLHVLDNFNANDYTDFLIPDYLDRRVGEYMFRIQYNAPKIFRLEGIWTPVMRSEVYAENGKWVPEKVERLKSHIKEAGGTEVAIALAKKDTAFAKLSAAQQNPSTPSDVLKQMNAAYESALSDYITLLNQANSLSADDLYPNTNKLKYGQFGFYGNFSFGVVDLGVSYYNGHYKQVSTDYTKVNSLSTVADALHYDKLQVFGLDAQGAAGPFTLRGEFAYNLTNDNGGDDPWVHNNSISYLAGFDVSIPLHNLNVNVQATGNFVLHKDKIEDSAFPLKTFDVDYDPTGKYSNNKLVVQLKDTFYYEKIELVVKGIYGFERQDLVLLPEVSYKIRDGWKARLSGMYIHNFRDDKNDSEFAGWQDNSFIQLSVNYTF